MRKEKILVAEISDVDVLPHGQLTDLLDKSGSGSGSGSEETQLYVKKGGGAFSINGAPYSIGISWSEGPTTGLYRTYISHSISFQGKLELVSDSLNFAWGGGYTIHFSGTLEFKYWVKPNEFRRAYHQFNDEVYQVPSQYWG